MNALCDQRMYGQEAAAALGRLFALNFGVLTQANLEAVGYDIVDLISRAWIARRPGRWSEGFQPAGPILQASIEALNDLATAASGSPSPSPGGEGRDEGGPQITTAEKFAA